LRRTEFLQSRPTQAQFVGETKSLAPIADFLVVSGVKNAQIALVIHELAANAMLHGQAKNLHLEVSEQPQHWRITLTDDGIAFDLTAQKAASVGELRIGGYGVRIIHDLASSIKYQRSEHKNINQLDFIK
jgi:anti-sigma regulatory factor (Ser/Thr protein kinase)